MKSIATLTLALCLLMRVSNAATYYVSSSTGSDTYTSTQAQNQATPWKTIAKLNSYMASIKPGDNILFKSGDTFTIPEGVNTGGLLVTVSGTSAQPIVIGSYGTGAAPIITYPAIAGFTGSGVYTAAWTIESCCSILFEDGIPLTKASSSACTDGNWYGSSGTLYYVPTSGTPAGHRITVANINNSYIPGIDLSNVSYVTVTGLQFNSLGVGVKTFDTSAGNTGLVVQNCSFNYCQSALFFLPNASNNTNAVVQNNTFYRCQNAVRWYTASALGGVTGNHVGCQILNNTMTQIGTTNGTAKWQSSLTGTDYEAIGLNNFSNGTIQGNTITNGYCIGISWYNISGFASSNNVIKGNTFITNGKAAIGLIGDQVSGVYNYAYNNNTFCNNVFINSGNMIVPNLTFPIYQGVNTTVQNYIVNNTFIGNCNSWYFATPNAPYFTIENNIVYDSGQNRWAEWNWTTKPATLTVDYNLYYEDATNTGGASMGIAFSANKSLAQMQILGMEAHSHVATNPLFVNASGNQYQLQSTSPAIDAGIYVGLPFYGKAPDIGAFEYVVAGAAETVKPPNPPKTTGTPVVY